MRLSKISAFLVAALFSVSLAACGAEEAAQTPATDETPVVTDEGTTPAPVVTTPETTTTTPTE